MHMQHFQSVWMYMLYLTCLRQVSACDCCLFSCTFPNKQPAAFFFLIALLLIVRFQAAHADVMHLHVGRTGCVQTFVFVRGILSSQTNPTANQTDSARPVCLTHGQHSSWQTHIANMISTDTNSPHLREYHALTTLTLSSQVGDLLT